MKIMSDTDQGGNDGNWVDDVDLFWIETHGNSEADRRARMLYDIARTDCNDGRDNDGDGLIDDADPACPLTMGQNEHDDPARRRAWIARVLRRTGTTQARPTIKKQMPPG